MHAIRGQLVVICLLVGLGTIQFSGAQPQLPERGLDKNTVETRFGAPQRIEGPVGEPPITKWIYADFIVVYEYDHVVHAVKRQSAVEQVPVGGAVPQSQTAPATPAPAPTVPAPAKPATDAADPASPQTGSIAEPAGDNSAPEAASMDGSEDAEPESSDRQTSGDTLSIPQ